MPGRRARRRTSKSREQGWSDEYTERGDLGIEREATRGYRPNHTAGDFVTRANPAQKLQGKKQR